MSVKLRKRFFTNHSKSSAMVVSLAVHAILIVVALSFVAVTVHIKDDQKFETKSVKRPKMPLKRLQVPVNMKKAQAPKLRKRIVVQRKMNQMPDIKMPEITGVKGGMGSAAGGGFGVAGGLGFSMPEIDIFGIKGKGEKIFIILDASGDMMVDEIDLVTGTNLLALARFHFAVDADQAVGNRLFGAAARLAQTFELEDLVELDELGLELGDDVIRIAHAYSSKSI